MQSGAVGEQVTWRSREIGEAQMEKEWNSKGKSEYRKPFLNCFILVGKA